MVMSLIFMFFTAAVCLLGPVIAAVILIKRLRASWTMFALGIVSYTVSQLLLLVPILDNLNKTVWFNSFAQAQQSLCLVLIALGTGIFEEGGRFAALRFLDKGLLTWENGVIFGLGHGGMEAFWIVGLQYISLIAETLSGRLNDSSLYFLFSGIERVFAVAMHIGFSMIVFYSIKHRKLRYLIIAVILHTIVDIAAFMIPFTGEILNMLISQGIFALFAAAAIFLTIKMKPALNTGPSKSQDFL